MGKTYKVIHFFTDLKDQNHAYHAGDEFPRHGRTVSEERLAELASSRNRQHKPLIEAVEDSNTQEELEPSETDCSTDTTVENKGKYTKACIESLKLSEIREIAKKLGFKISSTSKDKAVEEFMEKQG